MNRFEKNFINLGKVVCKTPKKNRTYKETEKNLIVGIIIVVVCMVIAYLLLR